MARRMGKRAFIEKQDRPEVKAKLDQPVSEMSVRDLSAILTESFFKHFKDSHKDSKELKLEKLEIEHWPKQQYEPGPKQYLEPGPKYVLEPGPKYVLEPGPKQYLEPGPKQVFEPGPDPKSGGREPGPDWGGFDPSVIDSLIREVTKLQKVVAELQQKLG